MNYDRVLRASNVLFVCCGYQVQWFNLAIRKCKFHVACVAYMVFLAIWYLACFRQHFLDSSIFNFLKTMVPILHKIIRLHLLLGLKIWLLVIFEMKNITKALNDLIKTLPPTNLNMWTRNEITTFICLFSGLPINIGFGLYIMYEMEFKLPTLNQLMHASALFLPHFALACSFKLLNLASLFSRNEIKVIHSKITSNVTKVPLSNKKKLLRSVTSNGQNSVELSIPSHPTDLEIKIPNLETLQLLGKQLERLASATRNVHQIVQKQMLCLFVMNSISLLGATYSVLYYKTTWNLILSDPVGKSLYAFNIGVCVFIFWDYLTICVVNYGLEKEKLEFLKTVGEVQGSTLHMKADERAALKEIKNVLINNFNAEIFFRVPITWQTLLTVNTLVGLAIAMFLIFCYLDDRIENLETLVNDEED